MSLRECVISFDPAPINMSYCIVDINTLKIIKWGYFSIRDSTNEGSCKKLANHLDSLRLTDNIESIIVYEQQPRCNLKTITITGQLQMYYVLEKMSEPSAKIKKIVGYHAKNKINYYIENPQDEPMPWKRLNALKKGHYKTKQILIEHCRRILKHNEETEWLEWFEKLSKKDDCSDSYVMALSYIKMNKLGKFKN